MSHLTSFLPTQAAAASYERGKNMVTLILALDRFISYAAERSLDTDICLPDLTLDLISTRPGVFAEAIDAFPELRSWILKTVIQEFDRQAASAPAEIVIHGSQQGKADAELSSSCKAAKLPLKLLNAASLLLSVWRDTYGGHSEADQQSVIDLSKRLLQLPSNTDDDGNGSGSDSAYMLPHGGYIAIDSVSNRLHYCLALFWSNLTNPSTT
jgi:hypothetical protein